MYTVVPLCPWMMPETTDNTECYTCYAFSYTYILVVKFIYKLGTVKY